MNAGIRLVLATAVATGIAPPLGGAAEPATPIEPLELRPDDAPRRVSPGLVPGSHVKVFLPSLPYLYTSHAINGALIRPSDNTRGWEYDMATAHRQIDATTYEFTLRRGVRFQDGTPFDAGSVLRNMEAFKKAPVRYSKIDQVFDRVERVDDHTVRFHLSEPYGSFMNDVIWMQFYTDEYLRTNPGGWNGKPSCPNLARPGPYGLGPYILTEGYIEGDRQTARAVLEANPHYWDPRYPKVEKITVFTELEADAAKDRVLYEEGALDIAVIPPEDKVETILAPYSKLVITPSTDNIAIHMNLINGHPRLRERDVRRALNEALDRDNLLHFVFEHEGDVAPFSPLFPGVADLPPEVREPYPPDHDPGAPEVRERLRRTLDGLTLEVRTQDRFRPLWRGIETQLAKVGVSLRIHFTTSEKDVFGPLLRTNAGENETPWDLLVWGNDDWYFNHPFASFFVFRTSNMWSTVYPDARMNEHIEALFRTPVEDRVAFRAVSRQIVERAFDEAYMLFVPTPHKVFAVNKEVVFEPYRMASIPLWKIQVTDQHWSVRDGPYPAPLQRPVEITRVPVP